MLLRTWVLYTTALAACTDANDVTVPRETIARLHDIALNLGAVESRLEKIERRLAGCEVVSGAPVPVPMHVTPEVAAPASESPVSTASLDWQRVPGSKESEVLVPSCAWTHGTVTCWTRLSAYQAARRKRPICYKAQEEYDCVGRRNRNLYIATYPAGCIGHVVASDAVYSVWKPVIPETNGERELTFVCALPRPAKLPVAPVAPVAATPVPASHVQPSANVRCCDGTHSPTCQYRHRGCCSRHGGVCE